MMEGIDLYSLEEKDGLVKDLGIEYMRVTLCVGGGMGIAAIFERAA